MATEHYTRIELRSADDREELVYGKDNSSNDATLDIKRDDDDDDELINPTHPVKSKLYTRTPLAIENLEIAILSNTEIKASCGKKYDDLLNIYLHQDIPGLKIKDSCKNIRICWTGFLGIWIVPHAVLMFNESEGPEITSLACQNLYGWNMNAVRKERYEEEVGHVKWLIEWASQLPPFTINAPQLFPFYWESHNKLPLFLLENTKVSFIFKLRNSLADLVRMAEVLDDGELREIPFNWEYIEGIGSNEHLPTPSVCGVYGQRTDQEKKHWRSKPSKQRCISYSEVLESNPTQLGFHVTIDIGGHHLFSGAWCNAVNQKSQYNRNYGNFTTNSSNQNTGWGPIGEVSFKARAISRLPKKSFKELTNMSTTLLPGKPPTEGYYYIPVSEANYGSKVIHDLSLTDHPCKISCHLTDTNPSSGYLTNGPHALEETFNTVSEGQAQTGFKVIVIVNSVMHLMYEGNECTVH